MTHFGIGKCIGAERQRLEVGGQWSEIGGQRLEIAADSDYEVPVSMTLEEIKEKVRIR